MLEPIRLTEKAAEEIRYIFENKNIPEDYLLRILAEGGGGCGGAKFRLGFDRPQTGDEQYNCLGIRIVYEKKQAIFLLGLTVDFEERTEERGFVFRKEN